MQQLDVTIEELCFLCDPCRDVITGRFGAYLVDNQFSEGGYEEVNSALDVEESPLLEAVSRKRLVKT
jgi:hypothetical protein